MALAKDPKPMEVSNAQAKQAVNETKHATDRMNALARAIMNSSKFLSLVSNAELVSFAAKPDKC
jgi:hypothetical protein